MRDYILDLINKGILTIESDGIYKCICGSRLLTKEDTIYSHMKTKKHLQECKICYMDRLDFYKCNTCKNSHCTDCYFHIWKCPFCRTKFYKQSEWFCIEQLKSYYNIYI